MKFMRRNIRVSFKEEKAITLIALVITIIVLLILAGVSIATLTGENGILTRANDAKTKTEQAEEDELRKLTIAEAGTHLENYEYTDKNDETITIPAGFAVSQVQDENTIADGLVIIDNNGNEFVWIPVKDINEMAQCSTAGGDCNLILQNDQIICQTHSNTQIVGKLYAIVAGNSFNKDIPNTTYAENGGLREPAILDSYDGNTSNLNIINGILETNYSNSNEFLIDIQKDYSLMTKSIVKYHGFYIARYEMSKSDSNMAQSKSNSVALTANTSSANTWYGLYAYGKTYKNTANSVESSMVWGSQYDAMIRWMQSGINGIDVTTINDDIKNTDPIYTGQDGDIDIVRNVYDLYGGRYEWTLEASDNYSRISRGRS